MTTILVTGATGFIGTYLVQALVARGDTVIATDLGPEPDWIAANPAIRYIRADMGREAEVQKLMGLARPDKVVHLVSILVGPCEADPGRAFRVNFMSTAALLDASLAHGVTRFVMTSAASVFGQGLPEPVANDAERLPLTVYGQTKLACENLLEWYRRVRGLSCGAVRFPWVFGPGRKNGLTAEYSSVLLDRIARGEPVVIDNPEERGDWLYVKDAVKALLLMLDREQQPAISYNIMGSLHSIREAMEIAAGLFPEARIELSGSTATTQPYASAYDDSRARADIGWAPGYTLAQAMQEHVATLRGARAA